MTASREKSLDLATTLKLCKGVLAIQLSALCCSLACMVLKLVSDLIQGPAAFIVDGTCS